MKNSFYQISILWLLVFIPAVACNAQKYMIKYEEGKNIQVVNGDSVITFNTTSKKPANYRSSKFYCWFDNRVINCTQGYSLGKLLDGEYIVTDQKGSLRSRGEFNQGLKKGSWITWYPDGSIKSFHNWRNGKLRSNMREYDHEGNLIDYNIQQDNRDSEEGNSERKNVWRKIKDIFKRNPEQ